MRRLMRHAQADRRKAQSSVAAPQLDVRRQHDRREQMYVNLAHTRADQHSVRNESRHFVVIRYHDLWQGEHLPDDELPLSQAAERDLANHMSMHDDIAGIEQIRHRWIVSS